MKKNFKKILALGMVAIALFVAISKTPMMTAGNGEDKDPPMIVAPIVTASTGEDKDPPMRIMSVSIMVPMGGGEDKDPPM